VAVPWQPGGFCLFLAMILWAGGEGEDYSALTSMIRPCNYKTVATQNTTQTETLVKKSDILDLASHVDSADGAVVNY
jgi:hypothetical protein